MGRATMKKRKTRKTNRTERPRRRKRERQRYSPNPKRRAKQTKRKWKKTWMMSWQNSESMLAPLRLALKSQRKRENQRMQSLRGLQQRSPLARRRERRARQRPSLRRRKIRRIGPSTTFEVILGSAISTASRIRAFVFQVTPYAAAMRGQNTFKLAGQGESADTIKRRVQLALGCAVKPRVPVQPAQFP